MRSPHADATPDRPRPVFNVLTDEEVLRVHAATLEVLERSGVQVDTDEALDLFADGGCEVDRETRRVRIPGEVVDAAIASAPAERAIYGRGSDRPTDGGLGTLRFGVFGEAVRYLDPFTGDLREPTKQDCADVYRLIDALPMMEAAAAIMGPSDVPRETYPIHGLEAALVNSSKSCGGSISFSGWQVEKQFHLAAIAVGGEDVLRERPIISASACPMSPLILPRDCCEVLVAGARLGLPTDIVTMALGGATGPATVAGTLVVSNVEILASVVLTQLAEPGTSVGYGLCSAPLDLRYASTATGSPEFALIAAAAAQLGRHYGLPADIGGAWADSKLGDAQMGHEKTLTALLPALAGAASVWGCGQLDSAMTCDPVQLVIDDEWMAMVDVAARGIEISDETLLVDDIVAVGPAGDYLSLASTLAHARDLSRPTLMERRDLESWRADGALDLYERARARTHELLHTHEPLPLDAAIVAEMRAFVDACDREVGA